MKDLFLNPAVQAAIITLLVAVIGAIGAFLSTMIHYKTQQIIKKTQADVDAATAQSNERIIKEAERVILSVVTSVQQRYVDALKNNGNWNEDTMNQAFSMAKSDIYKILSEEAKSVLSSTFSNPEAWIENTIDSLIKRLKIAENNSTSAAAN